MIVERQTTRADIASAISRLIFSCSVCVGILIVVEAAPKPRRPHDSMRLLQTMAYFATCFYGVHQLCEPRARCFWALLRWQYEGAPPEMEKAWKTLLEEIDFNISTVCWIITALLGSTFIIVIQYWFPAFQVIGGVANCVWWGAVISMLLFAYWFPASAISITRHFRFLRRQSNTCDFFRPKKISDLWRLAPQEPDTKTELHAPANGFVAGGRVWLLPKLAQSLIVFGSSGTGKTICVMNALLENLLASRYEKPIGGVILDFKGDFLSKLQYLCQKLNRRADLIVLSADSNEAWNPLDSDEEPSEIAARFIASMKALGQKDTNTSFFFNQAESYLGNAILLLRSTRTGKAATIGDIYRLVNDDAFLEHQLRLLPPTSGDSLLHPLQRCGHYFQHVFCCLPDDTRQSVVATMNNMLDPLCHTDISRIIEPPSTVTLSAAAQEGKLIYLHLPSARFPKAGRTLGVLLKLAFQAEVKRKPLNDARFSLLFADEFQEYFTAAEGASDTEFCAVSRQYQHINILATQNISNLLMRGDKPEVVRSFLSNVKTKIFLQNSDKETNEYTSQIFGNYVAELGNAQAGPAPQFVPNVVPQNILTLRTPEKNTCSFCESFILNEADSRVDVINRSARWPVHEL